MLNANNEERESILARQGKKAVKKQINKAMKKVAKAALKVAARAALAGIKALLGFLASIGLPFILVVLGVLFALFLIYLATTLMFSTDSGILSTGPEKELYEYIQQESNATVDMSKPEQIPYKVPPELIVAALQIYDSTKHGKTEKEVVHLMAQALKPTFVYTKKKGNIETVTKSCTKGKSGKTECTTKTENTPFELNVLEKVEAWDRTETNSFDKFTTDWANSSLTTTSTDKKGNKTTTTSDVKSRATTYNATNDVQMDYTYFDRVLSDKPFEYKETDKKMVEALYQATGGSIQYTEWLNGDSLVVGGMGDIGGYGSDLNVTPGSNVPAEYMKYYLAGQKKYGVDWYFLAAIHRVETHFSTIKVMVSSKGAVGHTQFMPCTWIGYNYSACASADRNTLSNVSLIKKYGGYGVDADGDGKADPWSLADAIMSTAKYLAANNFKSNITNAIWHYNHSATYIADVKAFAEQFKTAASYTGSSSGDVPIASGPGNKPMKPTNGRITSGFSVRNMGNGSEMHYGVDLANKVGTPIVAVADGVVTNARGGCPVVGYYGSTCGGGWGNYLWVKHNINGVIYECVYAHLQRYNVRVGQKVKKGQVIANMGSSGSSTNYHLHIETHRGARIGNQNVVNPMLVLPLQ